MLTEGRWTHRLAAAVGLDPYDPELYVRSLVSCGDDGAEDGFFWPRAVGAVLKCREDELDQSNHGYYPRTPGDGVFVAVDERGLRRQAGFGFLFVRVRDEDVLFRGDPTEYYATRVAGATVLRYVKFSDAIVRTLGDLRGAYMRRAVLFGVDFNTKDLSGVDALEANLSNMNLAYAHGFGLRAEVADFTMADLRNVDFRNSQFDRARFSGANLAGAVFTGCCFSGAELPERQYEQATFRCCQFR